MRKKLKNILLEIFETLYEAHDSVRDFVKKGEFEKAVSILGDCQDTAVKIGGYVEESEGEDCPVIALLLKYCEELYHISLELSENVSVRQLKKRFDKALFAAKKSFEEDVKVKLEVVFLPYKASMWDSLESIWKAADADPDCDAYVVPIPYYDRNPDHSFGEFHYEGNEYPDYVPVMHYNSYDIAARKPDVIYIHNPYDDCNYVTSVDPRYYSRELKKYTDCLVYVPYFVLVDGASAGGFAQTPGCAYADKVFVQSEGMRNEYIQSYVKAYGNRFGSPEEKIVVHNSPKIEKTIEDKREQYNLPYEWKTIIRNRKIILYNTSLGSFLYESEGYMEKLRNVLTFFKEYDKFVVWWRPHPLFRATLKSMRPNLLAEYDEIVKQFKNDRYGVYDDTADLHRALVYSDAYYGDMSSVVEMYKVLNKPIMIQNIFDFVDGK